MVVQDHLPPQILTIACYHKQTKGHSALDRPDSEHCVKSAQGYTFILVVPCTPHPQFQGETWGKPQKYVTLGGTHCWLGTDPKGTQSGLQILLQHAITNRLKGTVPLTGLAVSIVYRVPKVIPSSQQPPWESTTSYNFLCILYTIHSKAA